MKIDGAVHGRSGECKCLLQVFLLEVREIREQRRSFRISRQDFQHPAYRDAQAANALLTTHLAGLDGNPVERRLQLHATIMSHTARIFTISQAVGAPRS
jgi:hypothetical protein